MNRKKNSRWGKIVFNIPKQDGCMWIKCTHTFGEDEMLNTRAEVLFFWWQVHFIKTAVMLITSSWRLAFCSRIQLTIDSSGDSRAVTTFIKPPSFIFLVFYFPLFVLLHTLKHFLSLFLFKTSWNLYLSQRYL